MGYARCAREPCEARAWSRHVMHVVLDRVLHYLGLVVLGARVCSGQSTLVRLHVPSDINIIPTLVGCRIMR